MKNYYWFWLLFISAFIKAQTISGVVLDNNQKGIPGVSIKLKAKAKETITDFEGKFIINASEGDVIEFSYVGYETQTKKATQGMQVVLISEVNALSEVVVVGYGTKKKGAITGSVVQIKSDELLKQPSQSAIQAIQGKAAGVNIVTNDEPGAQPNIIIRGLGTVTGASTPLYVIDNVETNGLNGLSPNDIESIDILKDAASLAIYGQKGANGVVLISTKKGKIGEPKVTIDSYYGQKSIMKKVKLADAYRYAYYSNSAMGSSSYFNMSPKVNTNWLDEITEVGEVYSNSFSLTGASEKVNYSLSASHYDEKGILMGTHYKRLNVLSNNDYFLFDKRLKITSFVNFSNENNATKPASAFTAAYKQAPIMPVYDANGNFAQPLINSLGYNDVEGIRYNNVANPVAMLETVNNKMRRINLTASFGAELKITDYLKFNSRYGATYITDQNFYFSELINVVSTNYNSLTQNRYNEYNWNFDNFFTFKKDFGNHGLTAVLGMSKTIFNNYETLSATRYNVPYQDNYWSLDFSTNNTPVAPGSVVSNRSSTPIVTVAYFARAEYDYKSKYLLTAIVRREGISSFLNNQRYENFPSISAGWIVSKESFMQNQNLINFLKLKMSYGVVGNGRGSFALNTRNFTVGQNNYAFGNNQNIYPGSVLAYEVDDNLTWEKMKEFDFGFDFAMLENKLSGTIDYYNRKNTDVILPVDLPDVIAPGIVYQNVGVVTNKGIEATLNYKRTLNKNWSFSVGGNISFNQNELSEVNSPYFKNLSGGNLGNGIDVKQVVVGEPLGSFYVYQQNGYNSDGWFNYGSQKVIAGSYLPKYTYGLNLNLNYKNFDFSVYTYGVGGNKIYNGKKAQRFGNENIEYDILDSFWTPSTPNATNPKPFNDVPPALSYYVEDGSFFRINNITLGYSMNNVWKDKLKIRLYFTAINPFIFTKYTGYSPEVSGNPLGGAGIELDAYPTNRTLLFGANFKI
ncbi:MAG: TonB-dependent receptor [Bacteroidetes bacterium]|nr:TonB-dependent receptor [Bacteroidota bacterium]